MSRPDKRNPTSSPNAAPAPTATDPGKLRILAVDDEHQIRGLIGGVVREVAGDSVQLFIAENQAEAIEIFHDHYLDIILLDFQLGSSRLGGYSVLQYLDEHGCSAEVILMTKLELGDDADRVVQSISRQDRPRVMDYLKKKEIDSLLPGTITKLTERFETTRVNLTNLAFAVQLLSRRRDRYSKPPLRKSDDELGVEVERICRDLFGSIEGRPLGYINGRPKSTAVSVDLQPLDRRGLSAAVTLKPVVRLGFADMPDGSPGYDCVLKLGPIEDVREELARYREYVRYGVKLEQRVELLGAAFRDTIGGIVYSFAGGVFGQALVSLDELLRQNSELSASVVENLFNARHWYSVSAGRKPVARYMDSPYKTDLEESLRRNLASLRKMHRKHREVSVDVGQHGADSSFRIGEGPQLKIPGGEFLGGGWRVDPQPWCLVHGDMHGGNVMAELDQHIRTGNLNVSSKGGSSVRRVCLIDYRNSGPGPRCIDAIALESSVRMADTETIASQFGPDGASFLEGPALLEAMTAASRRVDTELQFYQHLWGTPRRKGLEDHWAIMAGNVVRELFKRFKEPPVSLEEYLQTAMLYAIRQLGYPMDGVSRVRINAWLAAQYILFRKLASAE